MNEVKKQICLELLKVISGSENPDSIEIGSPSKGGTIKVYGNYANKEEFARKIETAFEMRALAQSKMNV